MPQAEAKARVQLRRKQEEGPIKGKSCNRCHLSGASVRRSCIKQVRKTLEISKKTYHAMSIHLRVIIKIVEEVPASSSVYITY